MSLSAQEIRKACLEYANAVGRPDGMPMVVVNEVIEAFRLEMPHVLKDAITKQLGITLKRPLLFDGEYSKEQYRADVADLISRERAHGMLAELARYTGWSQAAMQAKLSGNAPITPAQAKELMLAWPIVAGRLKTEQIEHGIRRYQAGCTCVICFEAYKNSQADDYRFNRCRIEDGIDAEKFKEMLNVFKENIGVQAELARLMGKKRCWMANRMNGTSQFKKKDFDLCMAHLDEAVQLVNPK